MTVRVFTFVYGQYLDLFKRSFASLNWPENKKALEGAVWSIYTTKHDEKAVREIVSGVSAEITTVKAPQNVGVQLAQCTIEELRNCYRRRAGMLFAAPDTIFGDGTVKTLVGLGLEASNAIAVPHPRVVLETFPELNEPTSNARLVSLAFEHLHEVWARSNIKLPRNNVYGSGTAWRQIAENMYAVTMRIPTIYFFRPNARDVETLEASGSGGWDHRWPQSLVKEQRQRVIGSSDAAFMVELSPLNLKQGPLKELNWAEPDEYSGQFLHHQVNRNTVAIWRAES